MEGSSVRLRECVRLYVLLYSGHVKSAVRYAGDTKQSAGHFLHSYMANVLILANIRRLLGCFVSCFRPCRPCLAYGDGACMRVNNSSWVVVSRWSTIVSGDSECHWPFALLCRSSCHRVCVWSVGCGPSRRKLVVPAERSHKPQDGLEEH